MKTVVSFQRSVTRKVRERVQLACEWFWDLFTLRARYEAALQESSDRAGKIRVLAWQNDALSQELAQLGGVGGPPGLTAAEMERLAILAEECAEVGQAIGKILRHGWLSCSPFGGAPNRNLLERELGDLTAVMYLMTDRGDVRLREIGEHRNRKRGALRKWTHHQGWDLEDGRDGR